MSANIVPFDFNSNTVRTTEIEGEIWFCAKDICDVLELKNVSKACEKLRDSEMNTITLSDGNRGNPLTLFVSESGMYKLILRSRKPQAEAFADWVTSEVLVSIRKTGKYEAPEAKAEPVQQTLPERVATVATLSEALKGLGIDCENPRFKQSLQDLTGDILGFSQERLPGTADRWYGVAERAEQLGIAVSLVVKHKSQLGKAVKAQIIETDRKTEERLCNGTQRPIAVYRVSDALDAAIKSFFAIKAVA